MLPMSHKIRSKDRPNPRHYYTLHNNVLSDEVYQSLHEMHPNDAYIWGVTNDTQK